MPDGTDILTVAPPVEDLRGRIRLPASKSISNRALILQWLSRGNIRVMNLSEADDTVLLEKLLSIVKKAKETEHETVLDCENAGTVMRFLTALCAVTPGTWLLTGSDRMKERPIGHLVDSLVALGAVITPTDRAGYPPLRIEGRPLAGGKVRIDGGISSQFITALMLIAPTLPHGLHLILEGPTGSWPYICMTAAILRDAGVPVDMSDQAIFVPHRNLDACNFTVEPDWSSAAFWYEALALAGRGELLLEGLSNESIQGDAILARMFLPLGVVTHQEEAGLRIKAVHRTTDVFGHDFTHHPDLAQPLAATCAGLGLAGRLTGLGSLRVKETDRVAALQHELSEIGAHVLTEGKDTLLIAPGEDRPGNGGKPIRFETWDDHRMAMAMAPLCLRLGKVAIVNPHVVGKSYPGFWDDMMRTGFKIKSA